MKRLIALAAALGFVCALASPDFAQERPSTSHSGKIKAGKVKRSLPLRTAPQAPETQGGTLEEKPGTIIYF